MNQKPHKQTFVVTGMTCGHCQSAVESAIKGIAGVHQAEVDLKAGKAIVEGNFADEAVVHSVQEAGYEAAIVNAS